MFIGHFGVGPGDLSPRYAVARPPASRRAAEVGARRAPALLLLLVAVSLLASCSPRQPRLLEARLQKVLDAGIRRHDVNGVSAAIVFPDRTIWTGVSGISHDGVPIRPDMLFGIGSITKNQVAALTLKLAEDGLLSLDDPLSDWLPSYPHVDPSITVRQLLNHTSGLYMFWDNEDLWDALTADRARIWLPEEVLSYIKEPYFPPGGGWRYSNTNYLLMAMIIEKATASRLSVELGKRLWRPQGIDHAYLILEEDLPDNLAHVYGDDLYFGRRDEDVTFQPRASHESITWGSSGIFTTAEDLARWSHALFQGEVLEDDSLAEMLQFVEFPPVVQMRGYGLGVHLYKRMFACGKDAIGHGGGNIGSATHMVYLPDDHVSVVVMVNAYPDSSVGVMTRGLIRTVLRDLDAAGFFPCLVYSHGRLLIFLALVSISGASIVASQIRKRRRKR